MDLIDIHVHVGPFYDLYFSPFDIHNLLDKIFVSHYAVSSTSICEEDYKKVLNEIKELIELDGEKVLPVMWITPMSLKGNIAWFLESDIKWRILKIHPFFNNNEWHKNNLYNELTDIARELNLSILIHTGNEDCCQSNNFEKLIAENLDIDFILAHGRPLNQAIELARKYKNAYVDSAFMPIDHMKVFIKEGLYNKLLWGTDMCIPKYFYPKQDMAKYYINKLESFRRICSPRQFEYVTSLNAKRLFKI
ncbi:MAG: amidohydrolase [Muribaculaceae bacterium]|nr:amidohydrolase [Muribaculaceae bacterium]